MEAEQSNVFILGEEGGQAEDQKTKLLNTGVSDAQTEDETQKVQESGDQKRKSRWDDSPQRQGWGAEDESDSKFQPPSFSYIPNHLSQNEFEILMRKHRLDELNQKLQVSEPDQTDPDLRSPSPEPIYDPETGVKINTREVRAKEKYQKERYRLIQDLIEMDYYFVIPPDYRPPKMFRKIFIEHEDACGTNYIGMVIGPGGRTQKFLEQKTGCKISIRGEGANNKGRTYEKQEASNEQLHIFIQGETDEQVDAAHKLVEEYLDPDSEHKKNQLIEIAAIRGTLREDWCEDCGEQGHKRWDCPNRVKDLRKNEVQCEICKEVSHPTRDCPLKNKNQQKEYLTNEEELQDILKKFQNDRLMIKNQEDVKEEDGEQKPEKEDVEMADQIDV